MPTYFPQLTNAVMSQYPYSSGVVYETGVNDMDCGQKWTFAYRGGGLTGYPNKPLGKATLNLPILTDADLATLKAFFVTCDGRLQEFIYLDPAGNLVQFSELFSDASWVNAFGTLSPGATYTDPFGGSLATVITKTSAGADYLYSTILPGGFATGITLTASVWVNAGASSQSFTVGVMDVTTSTILHSTNYSIQQDTWVRLTDTFTIGATTNPIALILKPSMASSSTLRLFGAQASSMAGPGGYAKSPANYGYRPHCRFDTDEISWKKLGPNENSVTLPIVEFWV